MRKSATIRLTPTLAWSSGEQGASPLDARLIPLLAGIKQHATLRAAARNASLSYRAAWGMLGDTNQLLRVALVELHRGRGARLTEAGEQFLAANEQALARLGEQNLTIELAVPQRRIRQHARTELVLVASHDLLLAAFCDQWARPEGLISEASFRGSIESLKALARGEADIAGFHAVAGENGVAAGLKRLLDSRRDTLIRFAEREQGLMVPKQNPKGLLSLADVAAQQVRFVNRQRGSGTRLLIDQLLRQAGIPSAKINGYDTEEYTHLAVAATIAAGQAEAGFGLRAAAARLGLDFVSLRTETYWLTVKSRRIDSELVRRLREGLGGDPLRRAAGGLAGYSIQGAGTVTKLAATT